MAKKTAEATDDVGTEAMHVDGPDERSLSLKDVERELGISYPTLLRYKTEFADRIPSLGAGREQRFPERALAVIAEIYRENTNREPGQRRRRRRRAQKSSTGLLTLKDVQHKTGISYPTLRKYVDKHGSEIPSVGEGRRRRFPPEAVPVFQSIRARRGKGGRPSKGSAAGASVVPKELDRRLSRMEKSLDRLLEHVGRLEKELRKPLRLVR